MALLNFFTKVPVERTVAEVQALLASAGADEIMTRYVDRRPAGVTFTLTVPGGTRQAFALPVDVDGVAQVIRKQRDGGDLTAGGGITRAMLGSREHAERVAWRIAKDWLAAQLALVAAAMVTFDQVMLPYLLVTRDQTLYQRFVESGLRELEQGR